MHSRKFFYVIALLFTPLLMAGCANKSAVSTGTVAIKPVSLTMATGASGGTFVEYGNNMAKLISSSTPITLVTKNTGGSLDNIRCLNDLTCDVALVAMAPAFEAWNGIQWSKDKTLRGYSVMMPMYETPFHLATVQASGVTSFGQLAGKKVGVGPKGGANELIFRALSASLQPPTELVYGTPNEMAEAVTKGNITAFFFGAGAPVPAYRQIADNAPIVFLPIDGVVLANAQKAFPYLTTTTLQANSYRGQTQAVSTIGLWNFVLVRDDISPGAVYAMTRATLSRGDLQSVIHPTAVQTLPKNLIANTFLPVHPGAANYYREIGVLR